MAYGILYIILIICFICLCPSITLSSPNNEVIPLESDESDESVSLMSPSPAETLKHALVDRQVAFASKCFASQVEY